MEFIKTPVSGIFICKPIVYKDSRGYFFETFREKLLENFLEKKVNFCQDNEAFSAKGVLRGLHYQLAPHAQAKLVRVASGKIMDVAVDMRKNSTTFGKHYSVELSEENKLQLYIPEGFAHGYIALEDSVVIYKTDAYYNSGADAGILYNDKDLMIDWKLKEKELIISEKDKKQPSFAEAISMTD
jgi:dTDP-4-dehydrorhamnose 3,5-epimerase